MSKLAILGGTPVLSKKPEELFRWPIITKEDEDAALHVIRNNLFSGTEITKEFEKEFAEWIGTRHALAFCNGTMSLAAAMFGIGLGVGDEIICTTKTYWASIAYAGWLGATPVFCNINENLSIDPDDLERCITPKTKAIMVVHYVSYPADMDKIMAIAKKHNLYVIEDVSHAQGGLYKGRRLGTFGDVAAMSLMSTKSFAAGELGILVTDNKKIHDRAIAFAHYERNNENYVTDSPELEKYYGIAVGGCKGRANQLSVAIARVQLKYYDQRCVEIRKAMNYFWDLLEGVPGIRAIRVDESTGSNMAGWYAGQGSYHPEELGGLSVKRFCEAVRAEGFGDCWSGCNYCLHAHGLFNYPELVGAHNPAALSATRDEKTENALCDKSINVNCFNIPWFKHFGEDDKRYIEKYAEIFRKVAENYRDLLESDIDATTDGRWFGSTNA